MTRDSEAIRVMKEELKRIQWAMCECVSEEGYVLNHKKYEYQLLSRKAASFKESIEWLEEVYQRA